MQPKDFDFATELANTMYWNMAPEDFEFMKMLEPKGCLVLCDDQKPIGIATCVGYGRIGWFGNLIVNEEYRKKGGGSALVNHAVNFLRSKGVQTVGLYAYPYLSKFYGDLGFRLNEDFAVLHVEKLGAVSADQVLPDIGRQQFKAISSFDMDCFGGDRARLIKSIIQQEGNLSFQIFKGGKVVGYIAATVYEHAAWIGPLVCTPANTDAAVSLIKAVLSKVAGKSVYAVAPKKSTALIDAFAGFGFREEFFVSRMFLGEKPSVNCIYLAESLERG